jgi:DNA-binding transcriptional MerR regulator
MTPTFLTTRDLAARWSMHPVTLRSWRRRKMGPPYHKTSARLVLYSLRDVEAFEARSRKEPKR